MTEKPSARPMLEARDITLKFGGVTALANISIEIGQQELVALIGPNGAGKSSLLNVLSGFYRPSHGTVHFEGKDIGAWPVHRVAQAGLARTFQGTHLLPHMSVLDNILVGRYMHMKSSLTSAFFYYPYAHKEELKHRAVAEEILEFLELEHIRHHPVVRVFPAFSDHTLRGEIHDLRRAFALQQGLQLVEVVVQVDALELEGLVLAGPAVRQESPVRLGRPAGANDSDALVQEVGCKTRSRE